MALLRPIAFTRENRTEMIARVRDAFSAAGGWITDFHEFSNVSLCLNFEIPTQKSLNSAARCVRQGSTSPKKTN